MLILLKTLDTPGTRQVISLIISGQNGLIVSYRFHGRWAKKCFGRITEGSSSTSGDHSCFSRDVLNELELECFFFVFFICVSVIHTVQNVQFSQNLSHISILPYPFNTTYGFSLAPHIYH